MNNRLALSLAFFAGVAVGVFGSWRVLENKYKRIADEEIESVKETFAKQFKEQEEKEFVEPVSGVHKLNSMVDLLGYGNNEENNKKEDEKDMAENADVYVIPPESFGEIGYETESLTYYADKVLVDEIGNVIKDIDNTVGINSLETFGEYEDDSVFVRNDILKKDYEILLDYRTYTDAERSKRPHLMTDDDDE